MNEKQVLLGHQPAPQSRAPRRGVWQHAGRLVIGLVGIASIASLVRHYPLATSPDGVETFSQCGQVAPLFPAQDDPALAAMDEFLKSSKFREESAKRLGGAVQIPSESYDDPGPIGEDKRWDTFYDLAAYLETTFPTIYKTLTLEKVNTHGLLYTWLGSDSSLKPSILMAHQDVVPVDMSTVDQWTHPPYSGYFDGKYVWGRGSADTKTTLIGIMEAVELLIEAGFQPKRTVIISFGFDEESSGTQGAGSLAAFLFDRYGKDSISMIVDEGSGLEEWFGTLYATPAVGEKGYIDVEITVRMPGGHSSVPPKHNTIGVASELVTVLEANPYEPYLYDSNPFLGLMECGAEHSPEFPPEIKKLLKARKQAPKGKDELALGAAEYFGDFIKYLFTTSVSPDVMSGGVKNNALPERVRILVNHRVNIGDSTSSVEAKLTALAGKVADKYNLTLHAFDGVEGAKQSITLLAEASKLEPAPTTPTSIDGVTPYAILSGTTRALYGTDVFMAPGSTTGNTDTRFYWNLTTHIFRFGPGYDPEEDLWGGVHTVNEKISIDSHTKAAQWFSLFIRNIDEADLE